MILMCASQQTIAHKQDEQPISKVHVQTSYVSFQTQTVHPTLTGGDTCHFTEVQVLSRHDRPNSHVVHKWS